MQQPISKRTKLKSSYTNSNYCPSCVCCAVNKITWLPAVLIVAEHFIAWNWQLLQVTWPTLFCLSLQYSKTPCMKVGLVTLKFKISYMLRIVVVIHALLKCVYTLSLLRPYGYDCKCNEQCRLEPHQSLIVFRSLWWIDLRWVDRWWNDRESRRQSSTMAAKLLLVCLFVVCLSCIFCIFFCFP